MTDSDSRSQLSITDHVKMQSFVRYLGIDYSGASKQASGSEWPRCGYPKLTVDDASQCDAAVFRLTRA